MRGSSSPVELRRLREEEPTPATVPISTTQLSVPVKTEAVDDELEEGELVSPIKTKPLVPRLYIDDRPPMRDRWSSPRRENRPYESIWRRTRHSLSPQKPSRNRSPSPWSPADGRDDGWRPRGRRRSVSSPFERIQFAAFIDPPRQPSPRDDGDIQEDAIQEGLHEHLERPPSPLDPPPADEGETDLTVKISRWSDVPDGLPSASTRPNTPVFPPPPDDKPTLSSTQLFVSPKLPFRPDTPAFPPPDINSRPPTPALPPNLLVFQGEEVSLTLNASSSSQTVLEPEDQAGHLDICRTPGTEMRSIPNLSVDISADLAAPHKAVPEQSTSSTGITDAISPQDPVHLVASVRVEPKDRLSSLSQRNVSTGGIGTAPFADHGSSPAIPSPPSDSTITPANNTRRRSEDANIVDKAGGPSTGPSIHIDDGLHPVSESVSILEKEEAVQVPNLVVSLNEEDFPLRQATSENLPATTRRVTIAERRSVILPATDQSLSSPFSAKYSRKDPMPTMESVQTSTDAETEGGMRTGDLEETRSEASDGVREATKHDQLVGVIKATQMNREEPLDQEAIIAWNQAVAPVESSRIPAWSPRKRDKHLREITWPLNRQQQLVATHVVAAIKRETLDAEGKIRDLRKEYREFDEEWKEHCDFLDRIMEKRGPPPADLFTMSGVIPVVTPGPVPVTPGEDHFGSRANRRRGVGDAVTTEAEFQEILAGLADTAAKDPNFRASKTTAQVPDMLVDGERRLQYDNENDLVSDPLAFYDFAGIAEPIWTDEERVTFMRRYLAYPKQFGRIADGLPNKSASDCVLYYYRTKRDIDYKGILASRRGDKKRKAIPIKKSGKSSALLANLDRQKPTVNPASVAHGPKSAITLARVARDTTFGAAPSARRVRMLPAIPNVYDIPGRRRIGAEDEDQDSSGGPSRDGSEAPTASKLKMRMAVKALKRPRVSSASALDASLASTPLLTDSAMSQAGPDVMNDGENGAELLPPVKRSGKRRKVLDPNGLTADLSSTDKPSRRNATNSYWSVDEKRKFRDLVGVHGTNAKAIAFELGSKSERQVANFFDAHREDMKLHEVMRAGGLEMSSGRIGVDDQVVSISLSFLVEADILQMPAFPKQASHARSIYDVYPSQPVSHDHRYSEPRLGMFPSSPRVLPPSYTQAIPNGNAHRPTTESPVNPISRPGGMRISALLNDDGDESLAIRSGMRGPDGLDAASDGTVSERDAEGGVARASPHSMVSVPGPSRYEDKYQRGPSGGSFERPDLDRFRAHSAKTYYEIQTPAWPSRAGYFPQRAATATPALPHHSTRPSWDPPRNPTHTTLNTFPSRIYESYRLSSDREGLPQPPRDSLPRLDPQYDRQSDWRGYPPMANSGFGNLSPLNNVPPPQSNHLDRSPLVPGEALPPANK